MSLPRITDQVELLNLGHLNNTSDNIIEGVLSLAENEDQRAEMIIDRIIYTSEFGEMSNEVVAKLYSMAVVEECWKRVGLDKEAFHKHIKYNEIVSTQIEQFQKTHRIQKRFEASIQQKWGSNWQATIDPKECILPARYSERTLGSIRRMSNKISPSTFKALLEQAIEKRLENWTRGQRTGNFATLKDFQQVEKDISTRNILPICEIEEASGIDSDKDSISCSKKRKRLSSIEDEEVEEDNEDEEKNKENDEEGAGREFTTCSCKEKKIVQSKLNQIKKKGLGDEKLTIKSIEFLTSNRVSGLCWNYLRNFCTAIGLKTQVGGRKTLVKRIDIFRSNRYKLGEMKTNSAYWDWFLKLVRGSLPEETLGSLRFVPLQEKPFFFDCKKVLRRFAGMEAANKWESNGTIIVKGAMEWLFKDPEIVKLIKHEVQMYTHHRRMVDGRKSLGWLRSAYYTQIQQMARQDPLYYALVAATSRNSWQISYPYYMKATLPGDGISFQHIDLNVKRYIECGRGARRVQT